MIKPYLLKFSAFIKKKQPLILSFIIHTIIILSFVQITLFSAPLQEQSRPASIIFDEKGGSQSRLKYKDKKLVDRIEAMKPTKYVVPSINPSHVLPDIDLNVEQLSRKSLDFIHVSSSAHSIFSPSSPQQPLYSLEEQLEGAFAKNIQAMRKRGLDIVFLFDSTQSMGTYLNHVKDRISGLVTVIKRLVPAARIGVVTYRDQGADYVTRAFQLSYGTRGLKLFFENIAVDQGGDYEEAICEGLRVSIEKMKWKKDSVKIIILSGDAPPHKESMEEAVFLVNIFKEEMGGTLSCLDLNRPTFMKDSWHNCPPGQGPPCDYILHENLLEDFVLLAETGGGQCLRFTEWEKVNEMMVRLIFGSEWQEYWEIFSKNLS